MEGTTHHTSQFMWSRIHNEDFVQKEYNISGENILYCEGKSGIMDFAIMKACDHNITCYNMSFGGRLRIPLKTLLIEI